MIREQTIEYKIVSLIGLAGEIQTEELYKLKYGKEYIRKTISKLITKKCIKVYKFDNKKYLRLTVACKSTYWKIILKDLLRCHCLFPVLWN